MKKLFSALLGVAVLIYFSGCTTLDATLPTAVVESPEIYWNGEATPRFVARTEPAQHFKLADNASSRPAHLQNPPRMDPIGFRISDPQKDGLQAGLPIGGISFTASPKLQLAMTGLPLAFWPNEYAFIARAMAKYQWLGNADSPHMLSTFVHLTWNYASLNGTQKELFGEGGYPWRARANGVAPNIGVSYGYEWKPTLTSYVGVAYQSFTISANIHQEASTTGDYPAADATLPDSQGYSKTAQLGLVFGEKKSFDLAYSLSETHWENYQNQIHFLSLGIRL